MPAMPKTPIPPMIVRKTKLELIWILLPMNFGLNQFSTRKLIIDVLIRTKMPAPCCPVRKRKTEQGTTTRDIPIRGIKARIVIMTVQRNAEWIPAAQRISPLKPPWIIPPTALQTIVT